MNAEKDEFEILIEKYKDCPKELFAMAKTPFEKAVAVEFFMLIKKIDEVNNIHNVKIAELKKDISWLKWLIVSVFGIVVLGCISQWYPSILKLFGL